MVAEIAVAKDHELVRTGPYARIRHPGYSGFMALSIGSALLFLSYGLVALAVLAVVIGNYRARKEERLLASPSGSGISIRTIFEHTWRSELNRTEKVFPTRP